ncbi:serine/threonine-protein phosphatase 6 regulatory ankyrin repeat subunit B [Lingula anatina]|uniref:Serine/threonine-protein phosphatase 6 regulatory ankyrin repeat subunit B n=1 Tax=Lingula anatina TaxID=7574 RepID=A0A1S3HQV0_LINAN|nr:serine/threonine-protein phosphatase 6 regulatory ankyrin repeat subunit B-like [Lingula anatina]XP_013388412.1 serine/threonine-protein phosphatase 6 regulatory ankyrin repeat subunit B [Lingula anatina]|eukprot:XP_013386714.1 serine/threonine-protein phosphatase 6 regulatory ankyrin repeat subunit B-like [Lingula anatina]
MAQEGWLCTDTASRGIELTQRIVEASQEGDFDTIKSLLEAGVSVNAAEYNKTLFYASQNYMTPLQICAEHGFLECITLLIKHGAALDAKDRFEVTAVHLAAEKGYFQCLKALLDAGADCNIGTKYSRHGYYKAVPYPGGTTALHLAAKNNHVECVKELILSGADFNAPDQHGRTSLYIAAHEAHEECVLVQLSSALGRDILSLPVNITKETPLHECVRHGQRRAVRELLKHGSDVNHKNNAGFTPLHLAVQVTSFNFELLQDIVTMGYNVNLDIRDGNGVTALEHVSLNDKFVRQPEVAAFLVAYGANWKKLRSKQLTLLQQELLTKYTDRVLLHAMADSAASLPTVESLDLDTLTARGGMIRPHMPRLAFSEEKLEWYKNLSRNPRTLQHNCRCAIRSAMGMKRLKHIAILPLPQSLRDYLFLNIHQHLASLEGANGV